jgi:hypothetical protein
MDWLAEANVLQKLAISIFRAEVMTSQADITSALKMSQDATLKHWILPTNPYGALTQKNIIRKDRS